MLNAGRELPNELFDPLRIEYELSIESTSRITRGDEALVWRVVSPTSTVVVHASPAWRTPAELEWVHQVVAFAASEIDEAITPLRTSSGSTFLATNCGLITVYPFIHGNELDDEEVAQVENAGRLLALIHRRMSAFTGPGRPLPSPKAPQPRVTPGEPREFADANLDAWWEGARAAAWSHGVLHGDYYSRNLLCRDGAIVGVVDWHEARRGLLASELAFSAWEVGHDDDLNFVPERASAFIEAYKRAGGLRDYEYDSILPLMRLALRENARFGMDAARVGGLSDPEYVNKQARAFAALAAVQTLE